MTKLLFIKLLRDVQTTWGRIVMMIVAISLSLIVFSAMLYARVIFMSEMTSDYSDTNPASARMTINPGVAPDQAETILTVAKAEPGVIDATMRSVLTVQIQGKNGEQTPLQLFTAAPDDPMRIATFKVEQGSWPPSKDGVLLERSALEFLKLKVGDNVTVTGFDGKPVQLQVTGVVHDQSLAPAYTGLQGYGYISTNSLPYLGKQPVLNQLAITVADKAGQTESSHDRDVIVHTALGLADRLKGVSGVEIEEIAVPLPDQHPHQPIANMLLTALLAFGGLSLLLSAILIAAMFNGLLTQQIPQIGILKAIGARSNRILQLYSIMVLLIAAVATALAIIPGIMLGRALAQLVGGALNMDVTNFSVPWWTYASVITLGIALPLLMSLAPLMQASRRTVREALDERGVDGQSVTTTRFYAWLGRLRSMDRTLLMAFRNVFRRRARFLLSVGLLATAGAIFMSGLNTMAGLQAIPKTLTDEQLWDVEVRLRAPASASELTNRVGQAPGVIRVETWNTAPTGVKYPGEMNVTRTYPDQGHGSMSVTAIPSATSMFNAPPILEGRWLRADDTGAIVLPQSIRKTLPDVNVGDHIQLPIEGQLTNWLVVGIVKELAAATCPCVTQTGFEQATGHSNQANLVRIVTDRHDLQTRIAVGQAATQALTDAQMKVQDARPIDTLLGSIDGHSALLVVLILLIALAIGTVGMIGLGSTMSTNVIERTREFGVMSAIGASASTVRRLVVLEGVFIAVISCVVAAIPALVLTVAMGTGLGNLFFSAPVPFQVSVPAIVIWVVVIVLGAALATLAPAYRASRLTVREALAYL
jgi:putative ABC transport system permease protein